MFKKIKILAIDDESKTLDMFKLSIEAYGFEVLTADSSTIGLELAIREKPDLIFLDIRMPRMDGWGVCRELKLSNLTNQIPIVFLTAYSSERDKDRARELGISAYLTKPVDPDTIVALIKNLTATTEAVNNHGEENTVHSDENTK